MSQSRNEAKPGINMPPQRRASPTPKPKESRIKGGGFTWVSLETSLAARRRRERPDGHAIRVTLA